MLVAEPIKPDLASADVRTMTAGGPGLPGSFTWRGETLAVATVLRTWRETGPCTHGSGESYARKHWFEVETVDRRNAKIYFERKARGRNRGQRWWLFSIDATVPS